MPPSVALLLCWLFIGFLLRRDAVARTGVSNATWIVVVWVAVIGSRSVSTWFGAGGASDQAAAYDEGSSLEKAFYFLLIGLSSCVLVKRRVRFSTVIQQNRALALFFAYWLASVLWADLPLVAFKRWFKDLGNILMVLVVLSEKDSLQAIKAVFVRCACILIPLSVVFIRFIPDLGRSYHVTGAMMYTGVATHKNTLGALVLVSGLFFVWDFFGRHTLKTAVHNGRRFFADGIVIIMAAWLLLKSNSATSLACGVLGLALYFVTSVRFVQRSMKTFIVLGISCLVLFAAVDAVFGIRAEISRIVLEGLDRDPTLTGRTDAWELLVKEVENPLIGAGYNSFWSGERLTRMWEHYDIIQAHNGYVENFLNGGYIATALLAVFLVSAGFRAYHHSARNSDYARLQTIFLIICLIHNFTEASFNKLSLLWFILLIISMAYESGRGLKEIGCPKVVGRVVAV